MRNPNYFVYDRSKNVASSITGTSHPVAIHSDPYPYTYLFPWVIWNMPEGEPPTRILVNARTLIGVMPDSGELDLGDNWNVNRVTLVSGEHLWCNGPLVVMDEQDRDYMPHLTPDASDFLYHCIKWFEDAEKFPERIPDHRAKAGIV